MHHKANRKGIDHYVLWLSYICMSLHSLLLSFQNTVHVTVTSTAAAVPEPVRSYEFGVMLREKKMSVDVY